MKIIRRFWRPAAYIVLIATFLLINPSILEGHSFCLQYNLTGFQCAGCGVTRAFCNFLHGNFAAAAAYNPVFTYAVFPICLFLMLEDTVCLLRNRRSLVETAVQALLML